MKSNRVILDPIAKTVESSPEKLAKAKESIDFKPNMEETKNTLYSP